MTIKLRVKFGDSSEIEVEAHDVHQLADVLDRTTKKFFSSDIHAKEF